jgi:hypothetical protein
LTRLQTSACLDVVQVELGVNDLRGGNFSITLSLYDCNNNPLYRKTNQIRIPPGIFTDTVFFEVSPRVNMEDLFRVAVEVSRA